MSTSSVKLTLVNNADNVGKQEVVIFQKNDAVGAPPFPENVVAWRVVKDLAKGKTLPFNYSSEMQLAAGDSNGNYTPHFVVALGEQWSMVRDASGDVLKKTGSVTPPSQVDCVNGLPQGQGAITAFFLRDDLLLATKAKYPPMQKASFAFQPTLFIGVATQIEQGQVLPETVAKGITAPLDLSNIASADIEWTGSAPPYTFTLTKKVPTSGTDPHN